MNTVFSDLMCFITQVKKTPQTGNDGILTMTFILMMDVSSSFVTSIMSHNVLNYIEVHVYVYFFSRVHLLGLAPKMTSN